MTEARETAGFVLPFATGIFLATGPALITKAYFPVACTASLAVTAVLLILLMHPARRTMPWWIPWLMTSMIGLAAGAFAGLTSLNMDISSYSTGLRLRAAGLGRGLGDFVDRIPFGDAGTNALLKALITGERNDISPAVAEAFRDSGAAHILSLSGFHLGIIYGIVKWSLSGFGNSPAVSRFRSALVVLLCGFYTLITGAGPSIVRAFLFILLGETARVLHRDRSVPALLLSALLIQLVVSPGTIRSVSFQLSYAAMAGIAWIYPWLRDFWPGRAPDDRGLIRGVRWIWNSAALSIACQLTTGPLAYMYFGTFPVNFLLTNLIALPLTGVLIPVGLGAVLLSYLGLCPQFLLDATDFLASTLSFSLEVIAGM